MSGLLLAVAALAACNEGEASNTTALEGGATTSSTTAETRFVTVSTGPSTLPQATVPEDLVANCMKYVEYYAGQGDPYMAMLWNSAAGDMEVVRAACAEQWYKTTDANTDGVPDGQAELARMSADITAVEAFFQSFYTTTSLGSGGAATATTHPAATPVCPPNEVLTTDGFCTPG